MGLMGQVDIVLEAPFAAQEAPILETPHRLPDSELAHRSLSIPVVIPAQAGIHGAEISESITCARIMPHRIARASGKVDPGFRRDDNLWEG